MVFDRDEMPLGETKDLRYIWLFLTISGVWQMQEFDRGILVRTINYHENIDVVQFEKLFSWENIRDIKKKIVIIWADITL